MKFGNMLKCAAFALSIIIFQKGIAQENAQQEVLSLDLKQAIQIAFDENLTLKIADSEIQRVDYLKKEAWYSLFPTVNATGQYTNTPKIPVMFMPEMEFQLAENLPPMKFGGAMEMGYKHGFTVGAQANLPLFAMGLYRNIQLSELEMQAVLESARSSKLDLIKEVKNSFYGTLIMQSQYEVLQKSYANALETSEDIKNKYEQGVASEYDKIRAEVATRNILPNLIQMENAVELTKRQLKILLSLPVTTNIEVVGDLTDYENEMMLFAENTEYDLSNNTSLRTLDIQTQKLQKQLQLARSQRLPTLAAFGNFSSQSQTNENTLDIPFYNSFSFGLSLNIPIFNGFTKVMKEKQLKSTLSQMQLQYDLAEQNLNLGLQNSLFEIKRTQVQLESNKEAVAQAEKGYEISKVMYNTGAGTILELNDAENAMTQAMFNYNQSLYDFLKARNDLEALLGLDIPEESNNQNN